MSANTENIEQINSIFHTSFKQSWKKQPDYKKSINNDGDISNAYCESNNIPMKKISISIDDATYPASNEKDPDDRNSITENTYIEMEYSTSSDESDKTYVPDVSLVYPKTPREKTQRRIVLTWTLVASLLLIAPVIVGKFHFFIYI